MAQKVVYIFYLHPPNSCLFRRGDVDANGTIELTDGVFLLGFLFLGGPRPPCLEAADADDNATLELTDGVFVLNWLFLGGDRPGAPGPETCWVVVWLSWILWIRFHTKP